VITTTEKQYKNLKKNQSPSLPGQWILQSLEKDFRERNLKYFFNKNKIIDFFPWNFIFLLAMKKTLFFVIFVTSLVLC